MCLALAVHRGQDGHPMEQHLGLECRPGGQVPTGERGGGTARPATGSQHTAGGQSTALQNTDKLLQAPLTEAGFETQTGPDGAVSEVLVQSCHRQACPWPARPAQPPSPLDTPMDSYRHYASVSSNTSQAALCTVQFSVLQDAVRSSPVESQFPARSSATLSSAPHAE